MMNAVKAEFRKLLTVRSTYFIFLIGLALVVLFAGYIDGYRSTPLELLNPRKMMGEVTGAAPIIGILAAITSLLLWAHEYRHLTIMYTLTASNSRNKVILAKVIVVTIYSLLFTAILTTLSPLLALAGIHLHGHELAPQTFYYFDVAWRTLFYGWAYSMLGLMLAGLIRNQIGAIVVLFIVPSMVEGILTLLLKSNAIYLPFTALMSVVNTNPALSYGKAAAVFMVYLVAGWLLTWVLFLRRDAN
jgi:ABC-2 type transport system permease protein